MVLEEVRRKQTEISTWPLAGPQDAGRVAANSTALLSQVSFILIAKYLKLKFALRGFTIFTVYNTLCPYTPDSDKKNSINREKWKKPEKDQQRRDLDRTYIKNMDHGGC